MTALPPPRPSPPIAADCAPALPRTVDSDDLLAGGRELIIRHGTQHYRLLLTGQNKLILTK